MGWQHNFTTITTKIWLRIRVNSKAMQDDNESWRSRPIVWRKEKKLSRVGVWRETEKLSHMRSANLQWDLKES